MTRRKFLKTLGKILTGAVLFYVLQAFRSLTRSPAAPLVSKGRRAKFYRQADDLAG